MTSYDEATRFLFGRLNYERLAAIPYHEPHFKLDRMRRLCGLLDHPESHLPVVHVAGTKGKGSTTVMIAAILTASGYRTGMYTSPHLERLEERIAIDGRICSELELVELVRRIEPLVREMDKAASDDGARGPTYFEILTAMAFEHFRRERVDVAVIEVGLGGRLDSTNVCHPICSVITSISRDHVRQLGRSLVSIATEKAGIIRPGVPVISGVARGTAKNVIVRKTRELNAKLTLLDRDFGYHSREHESALDPCDRFSVDYAEGGRIVLDDLRLRMLGRHQHRNAAVALAACRNLGAQGWNISNDACRIGLAIAQSRGRVEVVGNRPITILDVAHNEASIEALLESLHEYWPGHPIVAVMAATRGKEIRAMLRRMLPIVSRLIVTQYHDNPRGVQAADLFRTAIQVTSRLRDGSAQKCHLEPDPWQAVQNAIGSATDDAVVCITGSFFLAAELLSKFPTPCADPMTGSCDLG